MKTFLKFCCSAILTASIFSCATEPSAVEIPKGIIVPDSMVQLLADLHLAESRLLLSGAGPDAVLPKSSYTARLQNVPARFLSFPEENHWMLKPQNSILWQREFFRWLDAYCK